MTTYLRIPQPAGTEILALPSEPVTIGRSEHNDVVIAWDGAVSRLHAVIERIAEKWCLRDLGSTNGTYLNGQAISVQTPLVDDDEIRVGSTRLVVHRDPFAGDPEKTDDPAPAPQLTTRECDVLLQLLTPAINGNNASELASPREIAEALGVTEAAVRQHFRNLYAKFGIDGRGGRRQVRLAGEALRRGAITAVDVRAGRRPR